MGSVPVIDLVEQREVVEHGVFALADLLEVCVHKPVSCVGAGVAATLRADRGTAAEARAGGGRRESGKKHQGCSCADPCPGHHGERKSKKRNVVVVGKKRVYRLRPEERAWWQRRFFIYCINMLERLKLQRLTPPSPLLLQLGLGVAWHPHSSARFLASGQPNTRDGMSYLNL